MEPGEFNKITYNNYKVGQILDCFVQNKMRSESLHSPFKSAPTYYDDQVYSKMALLGKKGFIDPESIYTDYRFAKNPYPNYNGVNNYQDNIPNEYNNANIPQSQINNNEYQEPMPQPDTPNEPKILTNYPQSQLPRQTPYNIQTVNYDRFQDPNYAINYEPNYDIINSPNVDINYNPNYYRSINNRSSQPKPAPEPKKEYNFVHPATKQEIQQKVFTDNYRRYLLSQKLANEDLNYEREVNAKLNLPKSNYHYNN